MPIEYFQPTFNRVICFLILSWFNPLYFWIAIPYWIYTLQIYFPTDSLFYWCFPSLCKQMYSICLFLFPLPGEIYTKTLLSLLSKKNHLWFLAAYWITSWHYLEFSTCLITIFHDIKIGFWKIIILYFQNFL